MKDSDNEINIPTHEEFIQHVDKFLKETGIKASAFGREFMGDSGFIPRLRAGSDSQLSTMRKICEAMEKVKQDQSLQKMLQEMME